MGWYSALLMKRRCSFVVGEEVALVIGAQREEVIVRVRRVDGGLDGAEARIADGPRGQPLVDIGVVGTLDGGIELADAIVDHDIVDGGAQLQQAAALLTIGLLQTVVDDGADVLALGIIADGLLLDDGGMVMICFRS